MAATNFCYMFLSLSGSFLYLKRKKKAAKPLIVKYIYLNTIMYIVLSSLMTKDLDIKIFTLSYMVDINESA